MIQQPYLTFGYYYIMNLHISRANCCDLNMQYTDIGNYVLFCNPYIIDLRVTANVMLIKNGIVLRVFCVLENII